MGTISNLSSFLQSELSSALQASVLPINTTANATSSTTGTVSASSVVPPADNQQLSPFAQLLSELQQLQQSDPAKYQQVTGQIATNLQNAAKTAQADGNSTAANQLNVLAADFTSASQSGQLPNIQDLAEATGGHHHGHHHHRSESSDSDGTSSTDSTSIDAWTSSSSQSLTDPATDPATIILNTLSSAGVSSSNS